MVIHRRRRKEEVADEAVKEMWHAVKRRKGSRQLEGEEGGRKERKK